MKQVLLDANVILRFLRNDDPAQSPLAKKLFAAANDGKVGLMLTPVTLAEVFYAFRASYKMGRKETAALLKDLLRTGILQVPGIDVLMDALSRVETANVDFGDALLAAEATASSIPVASFDIDFDKFPDARQFEWK